MRTLMIALVLMLGLAALPAHAQDPLQEPPPGLVPSLLDASIAGVETLPNLSTGLSQLYRGWQNGKSMEELAQAAGVAELSGDRVMVTLIMLDEAAARNAMAALPGLGGEVIVSFQTWIDAWVPVATLTEITALPGISLVREPVKVYPIDDEQPALNAWPEQGMAGPAAGPLQTEGVMKSGANIWHAKGWTGSGVKVAIVDSFKDYQQAQARGELPANITSYHPGYNGLAMGSEHGTACAEIIYDVAPGASLTFASSAGVTGLANVIVQLAQRGNKIISLSVGYQGFEPGDGTGIMHDAIRSAYQYGALVVQAAGNEREHHWDGRFGDANADHWHEFATGVDINWLDGDSSIAGVQPLQKDRGPFSINLRWNSWPTTTNDYDLYLFRYSDVTKKIEIVTSSTMRQTGTLPPNEFIQDYTVPEAGYYYGIGIQRWRATGAEVLSLSGHWLPPFAVNVPDRSLIDGATSPYALTVAAADVGTFNLEPYSSLGPTYGRGGALTGGSGKPNIAAYANVSTWAYNRNGRRFNGTSSATPHVAGAAALVMEAYPQARAGDIWNHLMAFAVDRGPTGYDYQYGYGVLRMWDQPPSRGGGSQTPPGQSCPGCAPQVGYQLYLPSVVR